MHSSNVVWAIDLQNSDQESLQGASQLLLEMVTHKKVTVQPVYVIGLSVLESSHSLDSKEAQKILLDSIEELPIYPHCKPPVMIPDTGIGPDSHASRFLEYCAHFSPLAIVINASKKTSIERAFLGSFLDKLIDDSEWPILLLPNDQSFADSLDKIVFPTDLSTTSIRNFENCVDFFAGWASSIAVISEVPMAQSTRVSTVGSNMVNIEPFPLHELQMAKAKVDELAKFARTKSFAVSSSIENVLSENIQVFESFVAQEQPQIIALTAVREHTLGFDFNINTIWRDFASNVSIPLWLYPSRR